MTNKKAIALVLGVMCFALTSGICIQVKTVKNTSVQWLASTAAGKAAHSH